MSAQRAARARVDRVMTVLAGQRFDAPVMELIAGQTGDPWAVLAGTILSLRTKDEVTHAATTRLLAAARDPESLLALPAKRIESLIYPVGFYRTKAKSLRETARILIDEHGGRVPSDLDQLLALPGVGRKTANLVLVLGFRIPAICVDTHVHRISNRLGFVATKTPEETERALTDVLPRKHWLDVNATLVAFGQSICQPLSPRCSACPVRRACPRIAVTRSR